MKSTIESGQAFTIVEMLFIAMLLFVSGPVLESATGRLAAQNRGLISEDEPQ